MSLHPPGPRRERILSYGWYGGGKSSCWTSIAEWIARTGSSDKLYVIDSDNAWDAMRPVDGHLDSVVVHYPAFDWDDYRPAVHEIKERATRDDWYVVDRGDTLWDGAQEDYVNKVFGVDIDEFYLKAKIANDQAMVSGDYGTNWTHIKKIYRTVANSVIRFQGHVLVTAAAERVKKPDEGQKRNLFHDSVEVVDKYGKYGLKPAGEKNLAGLFHTEILMSESPSGYRMSVVKDRQRKKDGFQGVVVSEQGGFVTAYLMPAAGWKP